MKSKKILTLVLAFCMVFSLLSPASAMAVEPGRDTVRVQQKQESNDGNGRLDSLVISGKDTNSIHTLRDKEESNVSGETLDIPVIADGEWTIKETEKPSSLLNPTLPSHIQELKELAETYADSDVVSAFIVLKDAPLVNYYGDINEVPEDQTEMMEMWQEAVITIIEEDVLEGEKLEVVDQFAYLTNSIVVETEFGNLEKIAQLEEVDKVFLTPIFYPCTTDADPLTVSSGQMSGVDLVWNSEDLGYTGSGMTIAILDTGLDLDHPSFAAAPEGAVWSMDHVAALLSELDLNAEEIYGGGMTADYLYYSEKVPFRFNYCSGTNNVGHSDGLGDHGTHVAGISAANAVEGTGVVGMAPDAQIIVMKVFNSETGGAHMNDILNALEDCMKLGVDVANLSLGSPAGFSQTGEEVCNEIYASIKTTDLIVDIAAGNEGTSSYGSLWGNGLNTTADIDNSTMSSPSTYANAMSVGSVDNNYVSTPYFTLADGSKVFYQQSVEYLYAYIDYSLESLEGYGELEYVIIPNLGAYEDFYDSECNSIVEGKVAVVKRGELSFY